MFKIVAKRIVYHSNQRQMFCIENMF